jgi:arylsulfatase A-like enzyme
VLACLAAACARERAPRSVVLVSLDTLRADHMGLYGYERDTTPYLDRLARECLTFERALAPASWTLISHMTMLTGLYPNQHGVVAKDQALASETMLLAERLRASGYQTIGLYFEGWIHARHGFARGFEVFRAHRDAEEAGEHLEEALAQLDRERPFFLFLHLFDIHSGRLGKEPGPIYDCRPPYDALFVADAAARLPAVPEKRLWRTPGLLDENALAGLVALYDGGIRYVDDKLSSWIEAWRAAGWLDEALLVVTADHGEALGQRGPINDHGGGYQEGLRVPLLVRHPRGLRAGERVQDPVHLVDVVPTALEFAGLARDDRLPGRSLFDPEPGRAVYAYSPPSFEVLWSWPEKLVHVPRSETFLRADLERDPFERALEPVDPTVFADRRDAFLRALGPYMHAPAVTAEALDAEALEALEDIGYF